VVWRSLSEHSAEMSGSYFKPGAHLKTGAWSCVGLARRGAADRDPSGGELGVTASDTPQFTWRVSRAREAVIGGTKK
jgi:hypothetical protein